MNPSSQIICHQDRGLQLALSVAPFTDITSGLFALSLFLLVAVSTVPALDLIKMTAKLYCSVSVLGAENFEPILGPIKQQRD